MSMTGRAIRLMPQDSARLAADPDVVEDIAYDEEEIALTGGRLLDVDKSWHGLHFLLNGEAWEVTDLTGAAGAAILGGQGLGPDLGYGPARLLTAVQVADVAAGLDGLDEQSLRSRYEPAAWEESDVYPSAWEASAWEASAWEDELLPGLVALRHFYRHAAEAGQEVLLAVI